MKKSFQVGSALALLVILAVGLKLLSQAANGRERTLSTLLRDKAELDALRLENQKLRGIQVNEDEISRLQKENGDLPMLRNQVRQLREAIDIKDSGQPEAIRDLRTENERLQQQGEALKKLPNRADCIRNLELIDAAKTRLIEMKQLLRGERVSLDDLAPFFPNGAPTCPDGGHYDINRVGSAPTCSVAGHSIP